jgi:hypothetical protein
MNNPQITPMRKLFAFATVIVFAVAIIITIQFNRFIVPSTAVAQQQQINSNTSASPNSNSSSSVGPLSLNTIFKRLSFLYPNLVDSWRRGIVPQ